MAFKNQWNKLKDKYTATDITTFILSLVLFYIGFIMNRVVINVYTELLADNLNIFAFIIVTEIIILYVLFGMATMLRFIEFYQITRYRVYYYYQKYLIESLKGFYWLVGIQSIILTILAVLIGFYEMNLDFLNSLNHIIFDIVYFVPVYIYYYLKYLNKERFSANGTNGSIEINNANHYTGLAVDVSKDYELTFDSDLDER